MKKQNEDNSILGLFGNNNKNQKDDLNNNELTVFFQSTIETLMKEKERTEEYYKKELIKANANIEKLNKTIEKLQLDADGFQIVTLQDTEELEEAKSDLEGLVNVLKNEISRDLKDINDLKVKNQELEEKIKELQKFEDINKTCEKINKELSKKNNEYIETIENLSNEKANLIRQVEQLNSKIKNLEAKNNNLLEFIHKKENTIAELMKKKQEDAQKQNKNIYSENTESLIEIISELLAQFHISQYSISLCKSIEDMCVNIEKIDKISQNSNNLNTPIIYYYNDLKLYYFLSQEPNKVNCMDFLTNYLKKNNSNVDQSLIEVILKIKQLASNAQILSKYKAKKEKMLKSIEVSFNIIAQFLSKAYKKTDFIAKDIVALYQKNMENKGDELIIDFPKSYKIIEDEKINIGGNNHNLLSSYYPKMILPNEQKVSIIFSPFNITVEISSLLNNVCLYCTKLVSLSLIYPTQKNANDNIFMEITNFLPLIFKSLPLLKQFCLKGIKIQSQNVALISKAFQNTKISSISLINCLSNDVLDYFSGYFLNNQNLKYIDLSENKSKILKTFLSSFLTCPNLLSMNFSNCALCNEDISSVSDFLQVNQTVTELNLSNNTIDSQACSIIGFSLKKNTSLIKINLNNCGINPESLLLLFDKSGQNLKEVILDNNPIGDSGLVGLCTFLKTNKVIHILSIKNCDISELGIKPFITCGVLIQTPNIIVNMENNKEIKEDIYPLLAEKESVFKQKLILFFSQNKIKRSVDKLKQLSFIELV